MLSTGKPFCFMAWSPACRRSRRARSSRWKTASNWRMASGSSSRPTGAPLVLFEDGLADPQQVLAGEGGAGGVQRRVEAEQPGAGKGPDQVLAAGEEAVLRAADHRHPHGAHHVHVVVVVPTRHGVDHP